VKRDIVASGFLALAVASACARIPRNDRPPLSGSATPFTLTSQTGAGFTLGDALGQGHVALVFYRGHW
jgi:hypothetical protein